MDFGRKWVRRGKKEENFVKKRVGNQWEKSREREKRTERWIKRRNKEK